MRRLLWLGIASIALSAALGFGLAAAAGGGGTDEDGTGQSTTHAATAEDDGPHGGSIERFHAPASCDLVATAGLPRHWTHGDYVTAVASIGGPELIVQAAHSECGMPMAAVAQGGGPPAHALEHIANAGHGAPTSDEEQGS
jgi:hypothetical protein